MQEIISYTEVRFNLPYPLPFDGNFKFEWLGEWYTVNIENTQITDRRSEAVTGFEISGNVTIPGQHGLTHIASAVVRFRNLLDAGHPSDPNTADLAREYACAAINRLIEVYSVTTNDFRSRLVMPHHDVFAVSVKYVNADGNKMAFLFADTGSGLSYPTSILELTQVRQRFDAILKDQIRIPIWVKNRYESHRYFEERQFALAIILINTALELLWADLLREGHKKRCQTEEEADKKMANVLARKNRKGTLQIFSEEFGALYGRTLKAEDSKLWESLEEARRLRKNVIHPWVKEPTGQETLKAMVTIERVISWLVKASDM